MALHTRTLAKAILRHCDKLERIVGAEVGVWRGHTSQHLFQRIPNLTLLMVDAWESGGDHQTMPKTDEDLIAGYEEAEQRTKEYRNRRVIFYQESQLASEVIADATLDFVFIDACHMYESVWQDIRLWAPKVRPGGLLCGHDYDGRGDQRHGWGVKRAVDEWAQQNNYQVTEKPGKLWFVELGDCIDGRLQTLRIRGPAEDR